MKKQQEKFKYAQVSEVSHTNLYNLVNRMFNERSIEVPPFQRIGGKVWDDRSRKLFRQCIASSGCTIEGTIILFKISGKKEVYVLDGLQRITEAHSFLMEEAKKGSKGEKDAILLLKKTLTATILYEYEDFVEAHKGFIRANLSFTLTPFEGYLGYLIDPIRDDYSEVWTPLLNTLHTKMAEIIASADPKSQPRRQNDQKFQRDNYGLLMREIEGPHQQQKYDVGKASLDADTVFNARRSGKLIESRLGNKFKEMGIVKITSCLNGLLDKAETYVDLYNQEWKRATRRGILNLPDGTRIEKPTIVNVRCAVACAIYGADTQGRSEKEVCKFFAEYIEITKGASGASDRKRDKRSIHTGSVSSVVKLMNLHGVSTSYFIPDTIPKTKTKTTQKHNRKLLPQQV